MKPISRRALPIAALSVLVYLASAGPTATPANACSCGFVTQIVAPREGDQAVPTNARLWMKLAPFEVEAATVTVDPPTATATDSRDITLAGGRILRSFTLNGLVPGTSYTVSVDSPASGVSSVTFRVADVTPSGIEVPKLISCEEDKETSSLFGGISSCGEWHKVDIEARAPKAAVMLALRDGDGSLDEAAFTGKVTAASSSFESDIHRFYLGNAPCGPVTWNIDEGSTSVKVASYDIAGNFSGWSASNKVVAGCEGGGGDLGGPMLGLAFALLVWMRRRA